MQASKEFSCKTAIKFSEYLHFSMAARCPKGASTQFKVCSISRREHKYWCRKYQLHL